MKRLLVVLLLYMFGRRTATIWNFVGLLVCTIGLVAYAWVKSKSKEGISVRDLPRTIRVKLGIIAISTIGILTIISPRLAVSSPPNNSHGVVRQFETFYPSNPTRDTLENFSSVDINSFYDRHHPLTLNNFTKISPPLIKVSHHLPRQRVTDVNFLSKELTSSFGIITEAQRLHFDILRKELKNFKYAFVIDIAAFENKGDPAITVGEIYFLARMNIEVKYYCSAMQCSRKFLEKARDLAKNYTTSELVILNHGGGNIIGYPSRDRVRFEMFKFFPTFKIFVFPQSIWVRNWVDPHINLTIKNYCCNPKLTIVLRDSLSYSIAKKLYNGTTRLLMLPDMAFQMGHVERFMAPVFDIMWIKRQDGETPGYALPKNIPGNFKVHVSDWLKWPTPRAGTALEKAFHVTTSGFFYLQRGRVVITDRLHGHILSTLMDIPHVLIDNKAKKLSSYHNTWTKSLSNTVITDDPTKALGLAIELLKKYNDTLTPTVPFLDIREDFRKVVNNVPDTGYP